MAYQVNPTQIIQMIREGQNPQQLMMQILSGGMANSPMRDNLMTLVQNRDGASIEQIARNLCAQRGVDFETEFNAFRKTLGL